MSLRPQVHYEAKQARTHREMAGKLIGRKNAARPSRSSVAPAPSQPATESTVTPSRPEGWSEGPSAPDDEVKQE